MAPQPQDGGKLNWQDFADEFHSILENCGILRQRLSQEAHAKGVRFFGSQPSLSRMLNPEDPTGKSRPPTRNELLTVFEIVKRLDESRGFTQAAANRLLIARGIEEMDRTEAQEIFGGKAADGSERHHGDELPTAERARRKITEQTQIALDRYKRDEDGRTTIVIRVEGQEVVLPHIELWFGECDEEGCFCQARDEVFQHVSDLFRIAAEERLEELDRKKRPESYGGNMARLLEWQQDESGIRLVFGRSDYRDYELTGWLIEENESVSLAGKRVLVAEAIEPGPQLSSLRETRVSCHLGVSCLIISDNPNGELGPCALLAERAPHLRTHPGLRGPSASGAMNRVEGSPFEFIRVEIDDELGLAPDELSLLVMVGLTRELLRGGKPECFFVGITPLSIEEIRAKWRGARDGMYRNDGTIEQPRWRGEAVALEPISLKPSTLNRDFAANDTLSPSARANAYFLSKWLQESPRGKAFQATKPRSSP